MEKIMRQIILSLIFIFFAGVGASAQSVAEQARLAYDSAQYHKAIDILEKEMLAQKENGVESADLYYNLGNAYYRIDNLGKARLYYERATLLNPGDRDTQRNINFIKSKMVDKIPIADSFFVKVWFHSVQNWFSADGWAKIGVTCFLLLIIAAGFYFFSKKEIMKKAGFYVGISMVIFTIFANVFAFNQKRQIEEREFAIVMAKEAVIHSSPDSNSTSLMLIHEGTKVLISKEDRYWLEVEIENGVIGWIQREKIEQI